MRILPLLMFAASAVTTHAQSPAGSILHIEFVNSTLYVRGYCGPSDRGMNPNKLPSVPGAAGLGIADIVSVNGQPVKGTAIENINSATISANFTPGTAIGDFQGAPVATSWDLGFLNVDGTTIGTVHIDGQGGGSRPPGAPKEITAAAWTVTGGTGAFFGARGYFQAAQDSVSPERRTTDCEDRRINADPGGNKRHPILYLVPLVQPQIVWIANGPAVVHVNDGALVTTARPAKSGEILTLYASGLGPTNPGVDPGQPFTASPSQLVNSPAQVLVNGSPADVSYAGGYPGAVDVYQVNFRIPDGVTAGQASVQLTSAWLGGPIANIAIQ
jgi:hypothetical protein